MMIRRIRPWALVVLGVCWVVVTCWLLGCTMLLTESTAPQVKYVIVPTSVEATYTRAYRAATRMGAVMVAQDAHAHRFTGVLQRVIALHVSVAQVDEGTQMTVTASVLPHQAALGLLTEADDFLFAYRLEP